MDYQFHYWRFNYEIEKSMSKITCTKTVHCSLIHNRSKLEITQMPINRRMDKHGSTFIKSQGKKKKMNCWPIQQYEWNSKTLCWKKWDPRIHTRWFLLHEQENLYEQAQFSLRTEGKVTERALRKDNLGWWNTWLHYIISILVYISKFPK